MTHARRQLRALAVLALLATPSLAAPRQARPATPATGRPTPRDAASPWRPDSSSGTLSGLVTDSTTGQPVEGAAVIVVGTGLGAQTQASGRWIISSIPPGSYTVVARRIGYQPRETTGVRIEAGVTRELDFRLASARTTLASVQIVDAAVAGRNAAAQREAVTTRLREHGVAQKMDARRRSDERFDTEAYGAIRENEFTSAAATPLSTFSIDVDRASYGNVRRFVRLGQRPPRDAVRLEELVNYFPYDYAAPTERDPVAITTEVAPAPWRPAHQLVRIGLRARPIETAKLPPNNLVFLLDVSGSMTEPNKLPLVKQALRLLVEQLREQDRVALVVYAGNAGLVLPSTSGAEKERIMDAINALEAGGSTAGGAGLRLAYRVARESFLAEGNNRVVLATDGDFNVGESSDAAMVQLVEEERAHGVALTVLGFGMGNYKDAKLEQLADKGNGNYAYIDDLMEARKTLVHEMGGTLAIVAKDVKLQVEFNPARVAGYRLIGYEDRLLRDEDFANDGVDAGDMGAGHTVTALYEIVPVGAESGVTIHGVDALRYRRPGSLAHGHDGELLNVKLRYKPPQGATSILMQHPVRATVTEPSADFRFAAAVAEYGMVLRDSKFRGGSTLAGAVRLASGALGDDRFGYRREFVKLVEATMGVEIAGK